MDRTLPANQPELLDLSEDNVSRVVDVLCDAFHHYPVMRFVLGESAEPYAARLRTLVHMFVVPRVLRGEYLIGIHGADGLAGAAAVSLPGLIADPIGLQVIRDAGWDQLGADSRARYEAFKNACQAFDVDRPHVHLNMIGVRQAL